MPRARRSGARRASARVGSAIAGTASPVARPAPGTPPPAAPPPAADVPAPPRTRLGELLLSRDLIGHEQLREALMRQDASGRRLGAILVERGDLDERVLAQALAHQAGVPLVDLRELQPDPAAIALVPESVARRLQAVPLALDGDFIDVAVADADPNTGTRLLEVSGRRPRLRIAPASDIARVINRAYRALDEIEAEVARFTQHAGNTADDGSAAAPIVRIVELLLTQAVRDRASDIHLEPHDRGVRVRFRVDGALHDVVHLPSSTGPSIVSRLKVLTGMNIVEQRRPQDGQFSITLEDGNADVRVAVAPTIWGEKVVLRILDRSRDLLRLHDLGMTPDVQSSYSELVQAPFGMAICAGPTGSGKTTTLYATLLEMEHAERNVTTIEDPVEYVVPSINQIQLNAAADVDFAAGLRAILRQDPDVILVGEIRDAETATIAVRAALTGHMVLSSLHATDAVSAVHRLLDMGVEPFLIASALQGVVAQRLVRRVCSACTAPYQPSPDELAFYRMSGGQASTGFVRGRGCNLCQHTGFTGRIGVYELLGTSDKWRDLVVNRASRDELRDLAEREGMRSLRAEGVRLVDQGTTTIGEILRSIWTM